MMWAMLLLSCGAKGSASKENGDTSVRAESMDSAVVTIPAFNADSAYAYVARQVAFGPRVPNTEAHEQAARWLESELRRHGATVSIQKADLGAAQGNVLHSTNIMGSFNPEMGDRWLLLAHYDTRPQADKDPDPANHNKPIDGANDGASGVGVLLEAARILGQNNPGKGIDILFVDAEDSGTEDDDESWALGARYFAENPITPGYVPSRVILLDMVGGKDAVFPAEYFSRRGATALDNSFRRVAANEGLAHLFPSSIGGAVNDDHIPFLQQGIPAIDIIDYRPDGFCPTWHTMTDNLENIDPKTLEAVGRVVTRFIYEE